MIQTELAGLIKDQAEIQKVWLTLIALWILQEKFESKQDEWKMIARKAKAYIKSQGIAKVDPLLNKINLQVIN